MVEICMNDTACYNHSGYLRMHFTKQPESQS